MSILRTLLMIYFLNSFLVVFSIPTYLYIIYVMLSKMRIFKLSCVLQLQMYITFIILISLLPLSLNAFSVIDSATCIECPLTESLCSNCEAPSICIIRYLLYTMLDISLIFCQIQTLQISTITINLTEIFFYFFCEGYVTAIHVKVLLALKPITIIQVKRFYL